MAEFKKVRPRPDREGRPRGGDDEPKRAPARGRGPSTEGDEGGGRPPARSRPSSAEALLEIAGEMEEQGRALMARARQLHRIAEQMERGGDQERPSGPRPFRAGGFGGGGGGGGGPRRGPGGPRRDAEDGGGSARPKRGGPAKRPRGDAPDWAPTPKKRKK